MKNLILYKDFDEEVQLNESLPARLHELSTVACVGLEISESCRENEVKGHKDGRGAIVCEVVGQENNDEAIEERCYCSTHKHHNCQFREGPFMAFPVAEANEKEQNKDADECDTDTELIRECRAERKIEPPQY